MRLLPIVVLALCGCPTEKDTAPPADTQDTAADCDPGPTGAAQLWADCAPDDGAALSLEVGLTDDTCEAATAWPHVRLALWTVSEGDLCPGCSFSFDVQTGTGSYAISEEGWERQGSEGMLRVDAWDGAVLEGGYTLGFDDGTCLAGTFSGPWCDGAPLCG